MIQKDFMIQKDLIQNRFDSENFYSEIDLIQKKILFRKRFYSEIDSIKKRSDS